MLTVQEFKEKYQLNHKLGLIDEESKLIMLWTPRAACTTACIMMFKHMGLLEDALKYYGNKCIQLSNGWVHKYRDEIFYKKYGIVNINDHLLSKKYFIFKVIRNPYDRAVSSYFTIRSKEKLKKISFEEFLKNIKINSGIFIDDNEIDIHITLHSCPQYVKDEEKYINKYVRLESQKKDIDEINKLCNVTLDLSIDENLTPYYNKHSETSNKGYLGNVRFDELPKITSHKCFYNELTKKLVEEIYSDDIINYKYKFYQ